MRRGTLNPKYPQPISNTILVQLKNQEKNPENPCKSACWSEAEIPS